MPEQRNLILAIALSILIILAFQFFYQAPRIQEQQAALERQRAEELATQVPIDPGAVPTAPNAGVGTGTSLVRDRAEVIAAGQRIRVDTPRLHGSINLSGGLIDDLTLADFNVEPTRTSPEVVLLTPPGSRDPYYIEFGWVPAGPAAVGMPLPGPDTQWVASGNPALGPGTPVTLSWDNGRGLIFERVIALDDNYMFTVTQRVRNTGDQAVALAPYGLVSRQGAPPSAGFWILHEGAVGVLNGQLQTITYGDLQGEPATQFNDTGGWLGLTDKYWLVSLIAPQGGDLTARVRHAARTGGDRYQVDITYAAVMVAPGEVAEHAQRAFAGAKRLSLLERYEETYGITWFSYAIDFGWFWYLTKPFSKALTFLGTLFGNFGVAILVFTVFVKALFYPLANKAYVSMSKMKALQPQMLQMQERYKDDKMKLQQEMMALYKKEKVNPLSGCLPIIIQIPVFFALYKVLFVTIEMRHAPFFGWVQDLSSPEPTTVFNLFGLLPFDPPTLVAHIGVWPILMGITMWLQQKLNPQPPDPVQQKVFMVLPFVFTFMLASFPVGLVIYWAWNNLLSIAQQWTIMKRMGVKPT